MIEKLNELRVAIDSKELELKRKRAELASLLSEHKALEQELVLAEKLALEAAAEGFVKVKCRHFTFPWHYMGGANPFDRKYGRTEIRYVAPQEALTLLQKREEFSWGNGVEYTKV